MHIVYYHAYINEHGHPTYNYAFKEAFCTVYHKQKQSKSDAGGKKTLIS